MTSTSAPPPTPRKRGKWPFISRLAPAFLALTVGLSGFQAHATPGLAQTALNEKLNDFLEDFQKDPEPDSTVVPKPTSTLKAKSSDLVLAVAAILEDPANTLSAADVVAGALLRDASEKVRSDRDKIVVSLIDQAIKSAGLAGDTAQIAAIVQAIVDQNFTNTKLGLTNTGRAAAIGQALKSATDPQAGDVIAAQPAVVAAFGSFTTGTPDAQAIAKQKFAATIVLNANAGTGGNSGNVASFVDGLLDSAAFGAADRTSIGLAVAKLVKKDNDAVGQAFAGTLNEGATPTEIQAVTTSALAKTLGLQAAASFIAEAGATEFVAAGGVDLVAFATALGTDQTAIKADNKTKGGIAGGTIKAGADALADEIYNALRPAKATDEQAYAAQAAIGNSDTKVGTIVGLAATNPEIDDNKLGAAVIAAISIVNPDSADAVGSTLGALSADKNKLAGDLAKAAKSSLAAGRAAAGVVTTVGTDPLRTNIAIAANKAAAKYISSITMEIGFQFVDVGNATRLATFAQDLTNANFAKASDIGVGASMSNPTFSDQVIEKVIFPVGTAAGKVKNSAAKVVGAVAKVIDVEEVAEIVTQVSTHFTAKGTGVNDLKVSTAAAIAAAAAKSINTRLNVRTANRVDEMGEVAASIVGQLITRFQADATLFKDATALAKAVSGVTASVIKALSKKETVDTIVVQARFPNAVKTLTEIADLSGAEMIAGDVANTLRQAINAGLITQQLADTVKAQLDKDIPKLGGKPYTGLITAALTAGYAGDNVHYESGVQLATPGSTLGPLVRTGSIIDPETDTRNF